MFGKGSALELGKARLVMYHKACLFLRRGECAVCLPVLTFTAYSNTGKTTYLEKLIPCLKAKGLRIAVIKHDGHDFQADTEGKDSWRFTKAGAEVVAVASGEKTAIFQYYPMPLDDIISHIRDADVILTEGYKYGSYPKIAVFRADTGKGLSVPAEECLAIVGDYPEPAPCPVFPLDDACPLAEFLLKWILEQHKKDV